MYNHEIVSIFTIWALSLTVAAVSLKQMRGKYWYYTSAKSKMIMTFINIALGLFAFSVSMIFIDISNIVIIIISSIICFLIIFIIKYKNSFKMLYLTKHVKNRKPIDSKSLKISKKVKLRKISNNNSDNDNPEENEIRIYNLKDAISRFFTVFNVCFCILNMIYFFILPNSFSYFQNNNSPLIVHLTILFWSIIFTVIFTANDWKYNESITGEKQGKKTKTINKINGRKF